MRIYTRKGDNGESFTFAGEKLPKTDLLFKFEGAADELNSHLGMVKAMLSNGNTSCGSDTSFEQYIHFLEDIQKNIMQITAHAADVSNHEYHFHDEEVSALEKEIDSLSEKLPEITGFVMPGHNMLEAQIHIARTVARKTERLFFAVNEKKPLCPQAGAYLNRLSDYLFVLARCFG
jgi:cob(I)alamin adenosyltransferase